MYTYNDSNCYNKQKDLRSQADKYQQILSKKINDISQNTSDTTPYYKVLYPLNDVTLIEQYYPVAKEIKENFSSLVVISMGGATLNPQSMLNLIAQKLSMNVRFLNNTDPIFFKNLIESLTLNRTAFLTISNSGETLETNALISMVLNEFQKNDILNYSKNFYFITNTNSSTLHKLALSIDAKVFPHTTEISGRYASFTNITTLIGLIAGLDMREFLEGGNEVFNNFWYDKENSIPARAAITTMTIAKPILVNIGYLQGFSSYLDWYSQIIAESLGKNSKGFTPLKSIAPNDHHSLLQLHLDGPKDKLFTMFHVKKIVEAVDNFKVIDNEILGNLTNYSIEKINNTIFASALETFTKIGLPVRTIILNDLTVKSVGGLIAHSMIEVILLGHLLEINPFDQPAVEMIKKHAKQLINR